MNNNDLPSKVVCPICSSLMISGDGNIWHCTNRECHCEKGIYNADCNETYFFHYFNEKVPLPDENKSGLRCDRCGHSLVADDNFMLSDRDDSVNADNDSIGLDCHCPNCGLTYTIIEHYEIKETNINKRKSMENKNKVIVINLIGDPGSGKSTAAAGIFYKLKKMGVNCELSLEFAKDKVWEEAFRTMDDQIYIFAKQYHKLWRLRDKVDVIITDSPLLVSILYNKTPSRFFNDFVMEQFNSFDNMTYFIKRPDNYQQVGRIQNEEESKDIDITLKDIMEAYDVDYTVYSCDEAVNRIVADLSDRI